MFAASKTFFQRVARATMQNGASKMTMATTAAKSYNASTLCAVRKDSSDFNELGRRRSYVGFFCRISNFQDCSR